MIRPVTTALHASTHESAPHDRQALRDRAAPVLAMLAAAVIFGTAAVPAKLVLENVPPFVLAEARWLIALGLLYLLMRRRGETIVLNRATWLLGVTGLAGFYLFYSYGLRHTTAANATLIAGGTPVIVALLSALFLGERITAGRAAGIVISLAGVAFIVSAGTGLDASLLGNVLILGSNLSWAIYTVIGRKVLGGRNSLGVLVGTAIAGLIVMAPLAGFELVTQGVGGAEPRDALFILYLAIGPSALAYLFWGFGLSRLEASQASVYGNVMPLAGAVAGYLLLDEHLGWPHLVGGSAIIAGVTLATRAGTRRARAPANEEVGHGTAQPGTT
jgi:drug/metabolite transporter (DMT)-like permease